MYKSPLHETSVKYKTHFWNDSCSIKELEYALEYGAVGATTNPVIVKNVIESEFDIYEPILKQMIENNPGKTEDEIVWDIIEYTAVEGSKLLLPLFEESKGQQGRISIQTNTKYYRSTEKMTEQAIYFNSLAKNMQVKMPVTHESLQSFEDVTFAGVSINATVSFSVAQAVAVAKAVEKGLQRRIEAGLSNDEMHPVCTIMVGRVGDWLAEAAKTQGVEVNQESIDIAGVAVMKNAYKYFNEQGYTTTLLAAAYRNQGQWTEFVGGNIEMTIPHAWIKKFNESDVEVESRMDIQVDDKHLQELSKIADFKKVYEVDGMSSEEFVHLGACQNTLKQFFAGYDDLIKIIRQLQLVRK